jgi:hypothetical protein
MSRKSIYIAGAASFVALGAVWIQPVAADLTGEPRPGNPPPPVMSPPEPAPAPGETEIPPSASPDEDAYVPASESEQQELLRNLRHVVACARERGANVPDPIAVDVGALIPWRDGEPDEATSKTLESCFDPEPEQN